MLFMPLNNPLETILRALLVYLFLLAVFRVIGRHEFGRLSPFDLILLLADTGRTAEAARILDSAYDQFPYGNAGQDGGRCACDLATLLVRA